MSATPEQDAYFALLRLPHNGPRSTAALQAAMATLRDYVAADAGKDPELVQDISEQIARLSSSSKRAEIERPWFDTLIEREALIRAQSERVRVLEEALRPFAKLWLDADEDQRPSNPFYQRNEAIVTFGDLRRARAALAKATGAPE